MAFISLLLLFDYIITTGLNGSVVVGDMSHQPRSFSITL